MRVMDCAYCGDEEANTLDHWRAPIVQVCAVQPTPNRRKKIGETVAACAECNGILSSLVMPSIPARAGYIATKLHQRYQSILKAPDWSAAEIEELGPMLRATVTRDLARKRHVAGRIAHAAAVAEGRETRKDPDSNSWHGKFLRRQQERQRAADEGLSLPQSRRIARG